MSYPGDTRAFLVDLSSCQGVPDLARARDEGGLDGIIQKVSEGVAGVDPTAERNIELAEKLGLFWAEYGFCRPSMQNPNAEVDLLWRKSPRAPAFVVMDLENHPNDWAPPRVIEYGASYLRALRARFGLIRRLTYSYKYFFEHDILGAHEEYVDTSMWIAWPSWPKPGAPPSSMLPPIVKPFVTWALWQYSADNSRGVPGTTVPGIPGVVDRNVYNGTLAELREWCGLGRVIEPAPIVHPAVPFDPPSDIGPITNE